MTRSPLVAVLAFRWRTTTEVLNFIGDGGKVRLTEVAYGSRVYGLVARAWKALPVLSVHAKFGTDIKRIASRRLRIEVPGGAVFEADVSQLADVLGVLAERYVYDEYGALEAAGAVVIDIGAHVGDSAIYFAQRGAAHVYAFEPFESLYRQALHNLALSGVEKRVTLRNVGVGARVETRSGRFISGDAMRSTTIVTPENVSTRGASSETVEIVAFSDVLKSILEAHPNARVICKVDCEGAEFEFLSASVLPDSVARLDELLIEYHDDDPGVIAEGLRNRGFDVEVEPSDDVRGTIMAKRAWQTPLGASALP